VLTGMGEIIVIVVLVAVVFGAGKLPQVMEAMGRGVKEYKSAARELSDAARVDPPSDPKSGS
jgi:sec-independent protein translocase protein TatA